MRITYDITQTGKDKAGCGYIAYSLVRALAEIDGENEYLLLNSFGNYIWDGKASLAACDIRRANFKPSPLRHPLLSIARHFWQAPPLDLDTALGEPDIVHSN